MSSFVVDRIEGGLALLEVGGRLIEVPATALPPGAREGSVLRLTDASLAPALLAEPTPPADPSPRPADPSPLHYPQLFTEEADLEQQRLAEAEARLARLRERSASLPDDIEL